MGYPEVASRLDGVDVFYVDIDTVEAFRVTADRPLAPANHPRVRAVVDRLDGEVLDAIARLWYAGKGKPEPQAHARVAKRIVASDSRPGELLGYGEVVRELRADLYKIETRRMRLSICTVPARLYVRRGRDRRIDGPSARRASSRAGGRRRVRHAELGAERKESGAA